MGKEIRKMPNRIKVEIKNTGSQPNPFYATPGSAGCDIRSDETIWFSPNETKLVHTGIHIKVPEGFECQVRPRSGLSLKSGLRVANSPGTIDFDYIGEVCIIIHNTNDHSVAINKGDRIAQLVFCPVYQADFIQVDELENTERGSGGFGSTGKN